LCLRYRSPCTFFAGQRLQTKQNLTTPDGAATLIMQNDGNLVMVNGTGAPCWATNTGFATGIRYDSSYSTFAMEEEGRAVVRNKDGDVVWSTHTERHPGACLGLESSDGFGSLTLYWRESILWKVTVSC
jgi:hypothetical protein